MFKNDEVLSKSMAIRSPIVTVLGHVDHGKSSILDAVRGSNIVAGEAGAITQAIGASIIPLHTIKQKIGALLDATKPQLTIPGLLFIDTPGHAAFTSLRSRGGSLADIAVLVVDITEGFKPQTFEAVEILKRTKTPFIIAANKTDLVPGFVMKEGSLLQQLSGQSERVTQALDTKMYELVGVLHERFRLAADRFDRIDDYTKQIGIVPCSAKTGLGLQELLMVLAGLAQKYLEQSLIVDVSGPGKGVILEVKEEKGLGKTIDVILYDGTLRTGDTMVYGTLAEPETTKVRGLFEPNPNTEMRDRKGKFRPVKEVVAATGVKISAPHLEGAAAGMPVVAASPDAVRAAMDEVSAQINDVQIETDREGVIIKADTLGSLEALITLLKEHAVPIRRAAVGRIAKKDVSDAESNVEKHPEFAVVLGFNVAPAAGTDHVKVIVDDVIYKLLESLEAWQRSVKKSQEAKLLESLVRPCKLEVLQHCVFRQSNPCIVGVEVLRGSLRSGMPLMRRDGRPLTIVKTIQAEKESLTVAERGRQVAVSLPNVTAGRQVEETDFLYADLPEEDFRRLKQLAEYLSPDEKESLKEIAAIKREHNPVWGV
ncbi:translation initiation factor IF-2 [Candidatus Woesearchaeota archaeon]|nr:translation initiation factor IF-2 [Candidatus Woesearchaeota archaeon]